MNNFSFGGGGKQRRDEYIGGRPKSDADYGPKKKRFDKKPGFGKKHDRPSYQASDRPLYKTNCTTCGKACEVPFRPDGTKPVLCRDCFAKNHPADRGDFKRPREFDRGNDRGFRQPERSFETPKSVPHDNTHFITLTKQVTALESKLDEVLALLKTHGVSQEATVAGESVVAKEAAAPKKAARKAAPKKVAKKVVKKAAKKTKK